MLPGVAPPGIDFTEASIAIVAVLSAAMVWVILVPVPLKRAGLGIAHGYRHVRGRTAVHKIVRSRQDGAAGES